MNQLEPKIYVACLAAYNNGYLHGKWINASNDTDEMYQEINKILVSSPISNSEEWAIHDYEDFGEIDIEEYTSLDSIAELVSFIEDHGQLGASVYSYAHDLNDARRLLEECYHGEFDSEEDFAYYWTHEVSCHEVPEHIQHYIDYKTMARDFFISDFFSIEVNRKVHVFTHL